MKRIWALLIACALLLSGCYAPYDGYDTVYYGFTDEHILGKTYEEILAYYGDPVVRVFGENEPGFFDPDGCVCYKVREDNYYREEKSRKANVYIAFDDNQKAVGWKVVYGPATRNSTGFGMSRYTYDLLWMTGKTAPEIRERYGFFRYEEYRDIPADALLQNESAVYVIREGDGDLGKMDEIILNVYFNKEGVATRFCEQYGYKGG